MLVLSRKKGESILIQEQIEVTVLAVEGDTVKLGIRAPSEVAIYRLEVYKAIQQSNLEAAGAVSIQALNLLAERLAGKKE
ncbi:carbon storage regulator, CsrA [Paenibacillaceae bacterium GAS479]|nr:carbon storage regulator, CsrA [Paenibacillaceae bacterium GAS479]